jgi:hypothetical protein
VKNAKASGDQDNTVKIYGNAFLGQSLWEKTDLFQSEKLGTKFEFLEMDEFLNESGLDETDVQVLDQLQKLESVNSNNNNSNNNNNNNINSINLENIAQQQQNNPLILQQQILSKQPVPQQQQQQNLNSIITNSSTNFVPTQYTSYKLSETLSLAPSPSASTCESPKQNQIGAYAGSSSSSSSSLSSSSSRRSISLDNYNDVSNESFSDFDSFNPKTRKFTDEELKPQPILKKSKKVF